MAFKKKTMKSGVCELKSLPAMFILVFFIKNVDQRGMFFRKHRANI